VPQELRDLKLKPMEYEKRPSPGSWRSDGLYERAEAKREELFAQHTLQKNKRSNL
jgi:hypothetical protein